MFISYKLNIFSFPQSLEKKLVKGISKTRQTFQKNISKEVVQFKKILNELAMDRRVVSVMWICYELTGLSEWVWWVEVR